MTLCIGWDAEQPCPVHGWNHGCKHQEGHHGTPHECECGARPDAGTITKHGRSRLPFADLEAYIHRVHGPDPLLFNATTGLPRLCTDGFIGTHVGFKRETVNGWRMKGHTGAHATVVDSIVDALGVSVSDIWGHAEKRVV